MLLPWYEQWYVLALASSVMMGLATILEKDALRSEYASAYSASFSMIIAVVSLIFLPILKLNISITNLVLIYFVSVLSTITYLLTARVFRHGVISATNSLNSTLPTLFIVLFAAIFLKNEVLTTVQYMGVGIILLATYIILFEKSAKKDFESNKYRYFIFIGAVISGFSGLLFKYLLGSVDPITYMVVGQIFMAVNMTVYMNFKYGGLKEMFTNAEVYKKELIAIVFLTIGYRITYYVAVASTAISLVSPMRNTISVIMVVLSGSLFFKERGLFNKILLSVMILIGAYLMLIPT